MWYRSVSDSPEARDTQLEWCKCGCETRARQRGIACYSYVAMVAAFLHNLVVTCKDLWFIKYEICLLYLQRLFSLYWKLEKTALWRTNDSVLKILPILFQLMTGKNAVFLEINPKISLQNIAKMRKLPHYLFLMNC